MDIDDDKYLQNISPGPTTPSQIHLQQLEPVLIGGDDMLDPIKEEVGLDIYIWHEKFLLKSQCVVLTKFSHLI